MTQVDQRFVTAEDITTYFIGSVLSGGGSRPVSGNSAKDWLDQTNELQQAALNTRLGIPLIYGVDAVHGHHNVYGATIFPHHIGLETRNADLIRAISRATAKEVAATAFIGILGLLCLCRKTLDGDDFIRGFKSHKDCS